MEVGGGTKKAALRSAILVNHKKLKVPSKWDLIDTFEVTIAHDFVRHETSVEREQMLRAEHRGVRGLKLRWGDQSKTFSPAWMLAANRSMQKQIRLTREAWGLSPERGESDLEYYSFDAEQLLITI